MSKSKLLHLSLIVLIIYGVTNYLEADDKELFIGAGESSVKPNIMILMDSSGSMNTIIFYPKIGVDGIENTSDDGYDPRVIYEGILESFGNETDSFWRTSATRWRARWVLGNNAMTDNSWTGVYDKDGEDKILCGSTGQANFEVGDWIINREGTAVARIKSKTDCVPVSGSCGSWLELENREGTFPLGMNGDDFCLEVRSDGSECRPVKMYGTLDDSNPVRYDRNYLKWLFIHSNEEQRMAVSHFSTYGTFDVTDFSTNIPSNCITPGHGNRVRNVFTRIQVAREVACKVATDALFIVNMGLYIFDDDDGGYAVETLMDMSEEASYLVDYKNKIYRVAADSWTPLAEALADIWLYYRPGGNEMHYWPVDMDSYVKPSPKIEHWCQQHFTVVMTDGESTYDEFTGKKYDDSIFSQYPVKRQEPWTEWTDGWGDPDNNDNVSGIPEDYDPGASLYCPNWTCWKREQVDGSNLFGTDYLDDVAYFMSHSDLFPEKNHDGTIELYTNFPGQQRVYTYTIGFVADNDLLRSTAINGDGAYYTANNYDELVDAFQRVFTSILLRNFAFSAITAPKKTATAMNDDLSLSYVGYFLPSQSASIWEGHLLAYELVDLWGFDLDNNGEMDVSEYIYESEETCEENSEGSTCTRYVDLKSEHLWDAAEKIPADRNLFTNKGTAITSFEIANLGVLTPFFGIGTTEAEALQIIDKINEPFLADVFHSDVVFVGPPQSGKMYLPYTNSLNPGAESYKTFYLANENRRRMLFTGTNDGILHMFYADDPNHEDNREAGVEVWGFLPDEVLPNIKKSLIEGGHHYAVDGHLTAQDIYFTKAGDSAPSWATTMCFGLRSGGNAYYQLDVTEITNQPVVMWKFSEADYSGESWGKPVYGRIKLADPLDSTLLYDRWVVILTGGFSYNFENTKDLKGKAVFVVDAGTGELLWMVGYHPDGESPSGTTPWIDASASDAVRYLTSDPLFNFPVPTSLTAVDKDQDGYLDSIYFGNTGGHFFRIDINGTATSQWKTYNLYKTNIETTVNTTITGILEDQVTVESKGMQAGYTVVGSSSLAMGYITAIDNKTLTIKSLSGTFTKGEALLKRSYDPLFISPAVAYDTCLNIWIAFGTGDRDRPRTNPDAGRFIALKESEGDYGRQLSDLPALSFNGDNIESPEGVTTSSGWYFDFYQADDLSAHELLFDPQPVILPDNNLVPHIYMNSYTSPVESLTNKEDPCDMPSEGTMMLYDISIANCGEEIIGIRIDGRIAGGGVYDGKEYLMYVGEGGVASVPPLEHTEPIRFPYPGGVIFWKEIKR